MIIEIPVKRVEAKFNGATEVFLKFDDFWRIFREEAPGQVETLSNPLLVYTSTGDTIDSDQILVRFVSANPNSNDGQGNDDSVNVHYDANVLR